MPRVVIELQANTAEAVAKIQQFAKAQRDTFDVIRAGNPAMDTARIKVSQLTEAKGKATSAAMQFRSALGQLPGPLGAVASQSLRLAESLTGPAGIVVGLGAAAAAMATLTVVAIKINSTIEQQKLGIAALVAATGDVVDAQGRQLQGVEKIRAAQVLTEEVYRQIQRDAAVTVATTQQLVGAFQAALAPARAAGLTLDQTRTITRDIVLAWGAMGRPMEHVNQEARALLSGTIDRNAELARALNITGEMVHAAKEQGRLFEFLNDQLKIFQASAELTGNTFAGLTSTIQDVAQILLARAFVGVFEEVRKHLQGWRDLLIDSSGQLRPELIARVDALASAFTTLARATAAFGEALAPQMSRLETDIQDIARFIGALEKVGQGVSFTWKLLQGDMEGALKIYRQWQQETAATLPSLKADRERMGFGGDITAPPRTTPDLEADPKAVASAAATTKALLEIQGKRLELIKLEQSELVVLAAKERATALERITALESIPEHAELAAQRRLQADLDFFDKVVLAELQAAQKREDVIKGFTATALAAAKGLGKEFEDLAKKLEVATLITATSAAITQLQQMQAAIAGGDKTLKDAGITTKDVGDLIKGLTDRMQQAVRDGFVPLKEAATKTTEAFQTTDTAVKKVGDSIATSLFNIGAASEETIRILDELIAKGKAAQAAASGGAVGGGVAGGSSTVKGAITGTGITGDIVLDSTVLGSIANQPAGSGITPFSPTSVGSFSKSDSFSSSFSHGSGTVLPRAVSDAGNPVTISDTHPQLGSFQHGGVVPGPIGQPVSVIAHGGEEFLGVGARRGGGPVKMVRIESLSVNIMGTLVDQQRAWSTLVEELGQALEARLR